MTDNYKHLELCPFCGGPVTRCPCIIDDPETDCNRIACKGCGHEAVWDTTDFEYNVKRWNARAKGWVSVGDKLPKVGTWVFVSDGEGSHFSAFMQGLGFVGTDGEAFDSCVKYWMPLPESPNSKMERVKSPAEIG